MTWSWQSKGQSSSGVELRYEPGNWGDVLKGTWALFVFDEISRSSGTSRPIRIVDPFAGAAQYPLPEVAAARLRSLGGPFASAQREWIDRGELASTGRLLLARADTEIEAHVFDTHPQRLESWNSVEGAHRIESVESGENALDAAERSKLGELDLALFDPYDFFDAWSEQLPRVLDVATETPVLVYLYNKAPRAGGSARNYRSLRQRVETAGVELLVGRVPSDAVLPRAFHEMWLLWPGRIPDDLRANLVRSAKALTCKLSTSGASEWIPAGNDDS
ncbi:MAG: hypothetical protein AAF517_01940 [Planctomycetota bacterium]